MDRAYVTTYGDLFCAQCGSAHDRAMERQEEEEGMYYGWDEDYP